MYSTYSTDIYTRCNTKISKAYLTKRTGNYTTYNKVVKTYLQ